MCACPVGSDERVCISSHVAGCSVSATRLRGIVHSDYHRTCARQCGYNYQIGPLSFLSIMITRKRTHTRGRAYQLGTLVVVLSFFSSVQPTIRVSRTDRQPPCRLPRDHHPCADSTCTTTSGPRQGGARTRCGGGGLSCGLAFLGWR